MGIETYANSVYGLSFTYKEALKLKKSNIYKDLRNSVLEDEEYDEEEFGVNDEDHDYLSLSSLWTSEDLLDSEYKKYNIDMFQQYPYHDCCQTKYVYYIGVDIDSMPMNKIKSLHTDHVEQQIKKICKLLSIDCKNKKFQTHNYTNEC